MLKVAFLELFNFVQLTFVSVHHYFLQVRFRFDIIAG